MRVLINNTDLNNTLTSALSNRLLYSKELKICAIMQYMTGARANDILNFSRWTLLANGNVQLQPQKNNLLRIFTPEEVDSGFYSALVDNCNYFGGLYYRKYEYYLERVLHSHIFRVNQKPVSTHLFRYNYARKMKENGFTDVEIKDKLGERQLVSAQAYIYSQISWVI